MAEAEVAYRGISAGVLPSAVPYAEVTAAAERHVLAPAAGSPASSVPRNGPNVVEWVEPAESFWLLALKNFGLTLATLGVYHFWGRVEARRKVMNAIHINGRPLDYTGTGREAFVSFLIGAVVAGAVITVMLGLFQKATAGGAGIEGVRQMRWQRLSISLPMLFLLGSVVYRKRQHILRRTWLSGQRFDMSGWAWSYAWQHFWSAFLVPLTLGWAAPWRSSKLEQRKIAEMHYGGRHFESRGELKPLYTSFAVLWFGGGVIYVGTLLVLSRYIGPEIVAAVQGMTLKPLANADVLRQGALVLGAGLVPLAVLMLLYRKAWLEHLVSSICFGGERFSLKLPRFKYLWICITNIVMTVFTLGALAPVAEARLVRFVLSHLEASGPMDLTAGAP